jgi:hypothetical protein
MLESLQMTPSRMGDLATGILKLFCTKDDKGMIRPEGLVLPSDDLLPLPIPLDFAEKLGVETFFIGMLWSP